jgi:hypothetical protein
MISTKDQSVSIASGEVRARALHLGNGNSCLLSLICANGLYISLSPDSRYELPSMSISFTPRRRRGAPVPPAGTAGRRKRMTTSRPPTVDRSTRSTSCSPTSTQATSRLPRPPSLPGIGPKGKFTVRGPLNTRSPRPGTTTRPRASNPLTPIWATRTINPTRPRRRPQIPHHFRPPASPTFSV